MNAPQNEDSIQFKTEYDFDAPFEINDPDDESSFEKVSGTMTDQVKSTTFQESNNEEDSLDNELNNTSLANENRTEVDVKHEPTLEIVDEIMDLPYVESNPIESNCSSCCAQIKIGAARSDYHQNQSSSSANALKRDANGRFECKQCGYTTENRLR